jgi:hypothetical protein
MLLGDQHGHRGALGLVVLAGDVEDVGADDVGHIGQDAGQPLGVVGLVDVGDVGGALLGRVGVADIVDVEAQRLGQVVEAVQLQPLGRYAPAARRRRSGCATRSSPDSRNNGGSAASGCSCRTRRRRRTARRRRGADRACSRSRRADLTLYPAGNPGTPDHLRSVATPRVVSAFAAPAAPVAGGCTPRRCRRRSDRRSRWPHASRSPRLRARRSHAGGWRRRVAVRVDRRCPRAPAVGDGDGAIGVPAAPRRRTASRRPGARCPLEARWRIGAAPPTRIPRRVRSRRCRGSTSAANGCERVPEDRRDPPRRR